MKNIPVDMNGNWNTDAGAARSSYTMGTGKERKE